MGMQLQFLPAGAGADWWVNKLGDWINVSNVMPQGSQHLHGNMEGGIRADIAGRSMSVSTLDAAVASFGNLTAYPYPMNKPPNTATFGGSFVLWDNLWGVNYILWFPFNGVPPPQYADSAKYFPSAWNSNLLSRFQITFGSPSLASSTLLI